ncbi:MAG: PepSY-like domain-containing protein [Chitinophagaceae bacterium]
MKQIILSVIVLMGITLSGNAQKEKKMAPPAAATTAFGKAFPGAEKVKWGKEKNDYEAEFVLKGKEMSAVYNNNGVLKETEEDIKIAALPSSVITYVKEHYPKAVIKEAAKITMPTGEINYEAEVNKKDLIFDASGKFIREVKDAD